MTKEVTEAFLTINEVCERVNGKKVLTIFRFKYFSNILNFTPMYFLKLMAI